MGGAHLDTNADGMVSYEDFLTHLFRSARDPRIGQVGQALVEHFGTLDEDARLLWRKGRVIREKQVSFKDAFNLFDSDGDVVLTHREVSEAFRLMKLGLSESDVERMMRDIDIDGDGRISIQEFMNRLQY